MRPVTVRTIKIGEGRPKICVPIVEAEKEGILAQAAALRGLPLDMAEWRADWYQDVQDISRVVDTVRELRKVLGDLPLLLRFVQRRKAGPSRWLLRLTQSCVRLWRGRDMQILSMWKYSRPGRRQKIL